MNYSTTKLGALLAATATIFTLSYNTSVSAAGLLDGLLEDVAESISKEVIDNITKESQSEAKIPIVTPPPSSNTSTQTRTKPKTTKPISSRNKENHQQQNYKAWTASINTIQDSAGTWITSCRIYTGGDGVSTIGAEISAGSVGLRTMPTVDFRETIYRGYGRILQEQQKVTWVVNAKNQKFSYRGDTYTGYDDADFPYAINSIQGNLDDGKTLELFRAFAKGNTVTLYDDDSGKALHTASLSGFSASYLKASEWCRFSPENVLKVPPSATSEASVATASLSRPNKAKDIRQVFQDWQVSVETYDTEDGDWVTNCAMRSGGEGKDSIQLHTSLGDAHPPEYPLTVMFKEATARGYATRLKENDRVKWVIDSRYNRDHFNSSDTFAGFDEDGIPFAENNINGDKDFLYALAHGYEMNLSYGNASKNLHTGSLLGFAAAYGKMAQWCGFSANSALN
ncbi:MAG: hypothetical protein V7784_15510 [Oceanospirillaceae bacterium]